MQSLRTRRPSERRPARQQQAPKVQRTPSKARDARKSRVEDRVKKRMSMRYADISAPTEVAVPSVPSLPIGQQRDGQLGTREYEEEYAGVGQVRPEEARAAEVKLLDVKHFDPDAYLKVKLANSTEAELKSLQSSLRTTRDETSTELQRNVFKNYAEFVHISKEIGTLENEMLELKESLSEWKSMPSLLHIDDSASVAERRRNVRSSVADLRVLYASQMQTLHTQIEGSSKFVPTTPGRHVVTEMDDGVLALNTATYKISHAVRFVLLDDAVLVARRKQRRHGENGPAPGSKSANRWVAERCWPLSEMLVLDTKDTANMTNVFKIRHGKETHVYRTEAPANKKSLLSQFRHIAEELAAKKRKEREGEHERRKSLWVGAAGGGAGAAGGGGGDGPPAFPDWMADLAAQAGMSGGAGAKDKLERDARWVGDFADELTVAIALREWDQAVTLVDQGEAKLSTMPSLAAKLTSLTALLTSSLLSALAAPTNAKSEVVRLSALLGRLHAGAAARRTFLASRAEVMRRRIRTIRFDGDVPTYVHDLAIVVFTGIKHTADWFLASFKDKEAASGFVDWAKKQMESYADMFRKQVYCSDADPALIEQARKITNSQSKKLLEDNGLDFRFLFEDLLVENPKDKARPVHPPTPARTHLMPTMSEPTRTPAPTPRSRSANSSRRSPAPSLNISSSQTSESSSSGARPSPAPSPAPPAPSSAGLSVPSASTPPRTRSPMPRDPPPALTSTSTSSPSRTAPSAASNLGRGAVPRLRPNREGANSPAPPPRSTERPESTASAGRVPAIAVPRRQGMF